MFVSVSDKQGKNWILQDLEMKNQVLARSGGAGPPLRACAQPARRAPSNFKRAAARSRVLRRAFSPPKAPTNKRREAGAKKESVLGDPKT